jgi:hypothetical protein
VGAQTPMQVRQSCITDKPFENRLESSSELKHDKCSEISFLSFKGDIHPRPTFCFVSFGFGHNMPDFISYNLPTTVLF